MKHYAIWERQGFYWKKEAVEWGTAATGNFVRVRETTGNKPYAPKPREQNRNTGANSPIPMSTDTVAAPAPLLDYQTEHWLTPVCWRDLVSLLFQGNIAIATGVFTATIPTVTTVSEFGTLIVRDSTDANAYNYRGLSCFLKQLDIKMPQTAPGSVGYCSLAATWVGAKGEKQTADYSVGTAVEDTDDPFSAADRFFYLDTNPGGTPTTTEYQILEYNLSAKNNGHLSQASPNDGGISPEGYLGEWELTGSVSCYDTGAESGSLVSALKGSLEDGDVLYQKVQLGSETYDPKIWLPFRVTKRTKKDVAGIRAFTYDFVIEDPDTSGWTVQLTGDGDPVPEFYTA